MKKPTNKVILFASIRDLIIQSQKQIVRSINQTILITYYEIGRMITEEEQKGQHRAEYAKEMLANLSRNLTNEFGKGYSLTNLEYIRKFYKVYAKRISQPVVGKSMPSKGKRKSRIPQSPIEELKNAFSLSWTHYIQLLKIEDDNERNFYEIEAVQSNWSVRELQRQFNASLFERLALSKDKKGIRKLADKGQVIEKPMDALKHHTVLEFLDLKEDSSYSESKLENAIISRIEHFMMELGKGFLFEGRQKRFTFEGDSFYVDLVFYNRLLRCFVLIELKIGKLNHQDIGQMQMYVNYYDRRIKTSEENPTIGIILCKQENKAVVEFTLPENNNTIFSREYKLYLPSKDQLKKELEV